MISVVEIRNWQSLRSINLELDRFTVIVGASSSGKTALMRAFRALASNVRGSGCVTRGAKAAAISVQTGDYRITLERTDSSSQYRILSQGTEVAFTKLAGAVPTQVTEALRLAPVPAGGGSLNFAGQFDRPYLLDDSGANVARVLGDLTNVSTLFEAVREANRRRTSLAATLKARETDLVDLRFRAQAFADLPARIAAVRAAERLHEDATALGDRITRLHDLVTALEVAEAVLHRRADQPELPTAEEMSVAEQRLTEFKDLVTEWIAVNNRVAITAEIAGRLADEEAALRDELHQALVQAGECPTCGQQVTARNEPTT